MAEDVKLQANKGKVERPLVEFHKDYTKLPETVTFFVGVIPRVPGYGKIVCMATFRAEDDALAYAESLRTNYHYQKVVMTARNVEFVREFTRVF